MKKRIILLLTFIVSFIMCTDIAKAANVQELTCVYDKTDSQQGIKLVQYKDEKNYGNAGAELYIAPSNATSISLNETNWVWLNYSKVGSSIYDKSDKKKNYLFTECPKYIKLNDNGTIKYENNNTSDYAKLLESESKTTVDDKSSYEVVGKINNNFKIFEKPSTEEQILKNEWITKCVYKDTNSKIEIYFSTQNFVIYDNNIDVTSDLKTSNMTISNAITLKDLIYQYDTHYGKNRCFEAVYKIEECKGTQKNLTGTRCSRKYQTHGANDNRSKGKYTRVDDESVYKNTTPSPINPDNDKEFKNCEDLIGKDAVDLINKVMKWIRIIVPFLLIVFGILDFSKAVFSSKEENIKKSRETFFKRILAAILVFLAPIFVELILSLANQVWDVINADTCIRK